MALVFETLAAEDLDLGTGLVTKTNPGGGTITGTQLNVSALGLTGAGNRAVTATWDPGSVSPALSVTTTVTVAGAAIGDYVLASLTTIVGNSLQLSAHIDSANTVRVVLSNPTSAAIDPASGTLRVLVLRGR